MLIKKRKKVFHVITACDAYSGGGGEGKKNNNVTVIPLYLLSAMLSNSADEELCEHGGAALPALHIRCLPEDCRRSSGRQRAPGLAAPLCSAPLCVTQVLVSAGCGPAGGVREQEEDGGRGGGAGPRQRRKRKQRGREMNRKWRRSRRRRRRPAVSGSRPALPEEAPCCSGPSKRSPHAPNQRLRGSGSPGVRWSGGAPLPRMASAGT